MEAARGACRPARMRGACATRPRGATVTDPVDAVRHPGGAPLPAAVRSVSPQPARESDGASVTRSAAELLAHAHERIREARALGAEASAAASAPHRAADDVEGVLLATRKADAAFRMLEAARNAMLEAYALAHRPA